MHSRLLKILLTALFCGSAAASVNAYARQTAGAEQVLRFASPQEAAKFLLEALQVDDIEQLEALVGSGNIEILFSGDDIADAENRKAFSAAAARHMRIEQTPKGDRATLYVGDQEWPFPLTLRKKGKEWAFDVAAGRDELLNRRVGSNELNVMRVLRAYVEAQFEYAAQDRDGDGMAEYAQKLSSDPGMQNGLYWVVPPGMPLSPLGPLIAQAQLDPSAKVVKETPPPYYGYYYKILYRQGRNAPGGDYMYVANGNMISGFALLAYPARYGESGVYTFIINHYGEIYQRDLGPGTLRLATAMQEYNPDKNWELAKPTK